MLHRLGLTWEMLLIAAGAGLAALVTLSLARRLAVRIFGPIFEYETLRLARKGHTFFLRTAFALLVLGLLFEAKSDESGLPRALARNAIDLAEETGDYSFDSMSKPSGAEEYRIRMHLFAAEFTSSFLVLLAVGIILVTPIYFATAISEEKEKRTLDFLLATELSTWDIVMGKFAARLLNLFGVLLAAVPVLAMTLLWGGVDWKIILYGFTLILFILAAYASVSLACSVWFAKTRNAVIASYVIVLGLNLVTFLVEVTSDEPLGSPISLLQASSELFANSKRQQMESSAKVTAAHFLFGFAHYFLLITGSLVALLHFRSRAMRHASRTRRVLSGADAATIPHPLTIAPNPPLRGDPLVWKERYLGRTIGAWFLGSTFWLYLYLILGLFVVLGFVHVLDGAHVILSPLDDIMRVQCLALGLLVLLGISLRMASCVSREREQQTLTSLLTLPISREHILRAKWFGTCRRSLRAMIGLGLTLAATGLYAHIGGVNCFLLPWVFVSHVWFFGNVGLLLSVVCRSTNRACSLLLAAFVLVVGVSWLLTYLSPHRGWIWTEESYTVWDEDVAWRYDPAQEFKDWTSPPHTWWQLTQPPPHSARSMPRYLNYIGHVFGATSMYIFGGLACLGFSLLVFRRKR